MDLIVLVLVLCVVVGFVVWLLTTKIPMPAYWAGAIQVIALLLVVLYLLRAFGGHLPNVLR